MNAIRARSISALAITMIAGASLTTACGGGDGGKPRGLPAVPEISLLTQASAEVGDGIISPDRMLEGGAGSDTLLVLTGRGESFPEGFLHVVDASSLQNLNEPIDVGANGAGLARLGNSVVVASRGTDRLTLVDPGNWRVEHQLSIDFSPGAITALGTDEVVVVGGSTGDLAIVGVSDGQLQILRRTALATFAYAVAADPVSRAIYVVQPLRGIEVLDGDSLSRRSMISLAGEPSRGALLWRDYLAVSNRDGYLHFIDRRTNAVISFDVAEALGLARELLPARGIDSGDLIEVDAGRLVLVNGRQDSLLLEESIGDSVPVRAVARLPGGSFATYVSASRQLYITQPTLNAVTKVLVPTSLPSGGSLTGQRITVGREVTAVLTLTGEPPAIAVITSAGELMLLGADGAELARIEAGPTQTWRAPLTTAPDGGLTVVARKLGGGEDLVYLDRGGAIVGRYPIAIRAVFSASENNGKVILVSRLYRAVEIVDLISGQTLNLRLRHDRPRVAARVDDNSWVVLHDTNPDIGVTLIQSSAEVSFQPFDDWFVGVVPGPSETLLAVSFNGTLSKIDANGRLSQVLRTGITALSDVQNGHDGTFWVTSENLAFAHRVRASDFFIEGRYRRSGLKSLMALPGTDVLVGATPRFVEFLTE